MVDRPGCDSLLPTLSTGCDIRTSYVLEDDSLSALMAILRSSDALLIYNVAEQSLMTVAETRSLCYQAVLTAKHGHYSRPAHAVRSHGPGSETATCHTHRERRSSPRGQP